MTLILPAYDPRTNLIQVGDRRVDVEEAQRLREVWLETMNRELRSGTYPTLLTRQVYALQGAIQQVATQETP